MPYGTGVMMQDLYGNRIYLNQEPGRKRQNPIEFQAPHKIWQNDGEIA